MAKQKRNLIVGVTGASGAIYAKILFEQLVQLSDQLQQVGVIFSDQAKNVWSHELQNNDFTKLPFKLYDTHDFYAPFASGSSGYDTLIICPCSTGTLGRIAAGISTDLMTRAADVMLKERRKLLLVLRETPLSLIHINNMKTITEAGGILVPAIPSFYSRPQTLEEAVKTVIDKVLSLAGFEIDAFQWGNPGSK